MVTTRFAQTVAGLVAATVIICGGTVIAADPARGRPNAGKKFQCAFIHDQLSSGLRNAPTIELRPAPSSPCARDKSETALKALSSGRVERTKWDESGSQSLVTEVGMLGATHAAVVNVGPGGSGRFWTTSVAVALDGLNVFGCRESSTIAWRNIIASQGEPVVPAGWKTLGQQGALTIWDSLLSHDGGPDPTTNLHLPLVYVLDGRRLVVDQKLTQAAIGDWAAVYRRLASMDGNGTAALHLAAAHAYALFAASESCPNALADGGLVGTAVP